MEELAKLQNLQWRNKAVNDTFEPGSTAKILTLSMALEEEFGMEEMEAEEIESIVTVGDLYKYMQDHLDL